MFFDPFLLFLFAAMQEKRVAANVGSQPTGGLLEASAQWGRAAAQKELTVEGGEEIYESQWRRWCCVSQQKKKKKLLKNQNLHVALVMLGSNWNSNTYT